MENQNKQDTQKSRSFWGGCFSVLLFVTNLILVLLLLNEHIDKNYAEGKYSAALDTIKTKSKEISSLEVEIEEGKTNIEELNSEINSRNNEIENLNSELERLGDTQTTRVNVDNTKCNAGYLFVDGRLVAGVKKEEKHFSTFLTANIPYKTALIHRQIVVIKLFSRSRLQSTHSRVIHKRTNKFFFINLFVEFFTERT